MANLSKTILLVAVTACFTIGWDGSALVAGGEEKGPAGLNLEVGSEPIRVSAKSLVWDHKEQKAAFHQEVVAQQKDLTIYADDLVIYFNEANNDVTRIVAKGNVRITQLDRRASCEEAVYDRAQNSIVLEGNPVLRQGQNEVRGKRVIFFIDKNRSVVESGDGDRVKVTLIPEKDEPSGQL
jgi:lipopolysaccharide export system protein LptA